MTVHDDPGNGAPLIADCLSRHYAIDIESVRLMPLGYDRAASAFKVMTSLGESWFVKIRSSPADLAALGVPVALTDAGVPHVLAPIRTRSGTLWCPLGERDDRSVVVYPFVRGQNATATGLSDDQWRTFGVTLRTVHDLGTALPWQADLRVERFDLPSATSVREMAIEAVKPRVDDPVAARLATFWRARSGQIDQILDRAHAIGRSLRDRQLAFACCHADIHAANLLVADDGAIWLLDWDGPMIAPRERDLLFVVGSRIAREVTPHEEDLFFTGYGPIEIDPDALAYFRYERVIEDLGEFAKDVFLRPSLSTEVRSEAADFVEAFFAPGGDLDRAEVIPRCRWPDAP